MERMISDKRMDCSVHFGKDIKLTYGVDPVTTGINEN